MAIHISAPDFGLSKDNLERQCLALREENEKLKVKLTDIGNILSWVAEIYPGRMKGSGGAILHITWEQWNALRRALGLSEQHERGSMDVEIRGLPRQKDN